MTPFFLHDAQGRIIQSGHCADSDFEAQARDGLTLRSGDASPFTQYFDGAGVVNIPAKPSPAHVFDYVSKAWIDPRTLDALKAAKWEDMKLARAAAAQAPLETPYGIFDADTTSANNIIRTAQLMQTQAQTLAPGSNPTDEFTLANNSVVELTAGQMVEVALLLAAQIKAAFSRGREVRNAIESAANAGDLAAISWLP